MAGRDQNVGRRDRIVRAAATPVVVAIAAWLYTTGPREPFTLTAVGGLAVLAFVLGTGAVTGTCGVYAVLGIDTCRCESEYAGGNTWG